MNTKPAHSRTRQFVDVDARLLAIYDDEDVDVACSERDRARRGGNSDALTTLHVIADDPV